MMSSGGNSNRRDFLQKLIEGDANIASGDDGPVFGRVLAEDSPVRSRSDSSSSSMAVHRSSTTTDTKQKRPISDASGSGTSSSTKPKRSRTARMMPELSPPLRRSTRRSTAAAAVANIDEPSILVEEMTAGHMDVASNRRHVHYDESEPPESDFDINRSMNDALALIRQMEDDERMARQLHDEINNGGGNDDDDVDAIRIEMNHSTSSSPIIAVDATRAVDDLTDLALIQLEETRQRRRYSGRGTMTTSARGTGGFAPARGTVRMRVPQVGAVVVPTVRGRAGAMRHVFSFTTRAGNVVDSDMHNVAHIRRFLDLVDDANDSYESIMELVEQLGQARREGLTVEQIARLPTIVFKAKEQKGEDDMLSCIVCMNEYKNQEKLRVLPCSHRFHKACIDKWLKAKSTCPICRAEALLPDVGDETNVTPSSSSSA